VFLQRVVLRQVRCAHGSKRGWCWRNSVCRFVFFLWLIINTCRRLRTLRCGFLAPAACLMLRGNTAVPLMLPRNSAVPVYPLRAADRNLNLEETCVVCACDAVTDQIECPWVPYCKGPGSISGLWCCVDHEHAQITGHILVTFKWELAGKLSFSVFQEKYDNQIESHAILNSPLSILVAPTSLSAAASTLMRSAGGGPVMPSPVRDAIACLQAYGQSA
jgi:hypothetical protein